MSSVKRNISVVTGSTAPTMSTLLSGRATWLKRPVGELKIISCHLGRRASICAIDHGRSYRHLNGHDPSRRPDHGNTAGDVDPGALLHLMRADSWDVERMDRMLNRESGLKGITGQKMTCGKILAARHKGMCNAPAPSALSGYRIRKNISALTMAALAGSMF